MKRCVRAVQVTGQFAGSWAEAQKGLKESGLLDVPGQQFQTNGEMSWPSAALLWAQSVRHAPQNVDPAASCR